MFFEHGLKLDNKFLGIMFLLLMVTCAVIFILLLCGLGSGFTTGMYFMTGFLTVPQLLSAVPVEK